MKVDTIRLRTPKTKAAAINQSVYIFEQLDNLNSKEENLMIQKSQIEEKVKKLQETLTELETQISNIRTYNGNWRSELERLKEQFTLTEAEILEARSELLRQKIANLQAISGAQKSGERLT